MDVFKIIMIIVAVVSFSVGLFLTFYFCTDKRSQRKKYFSMVDGLENDVKDREL